MRVCVCTRSSMTPGGRQISGYISGAKGWRGGGTDERLQDPQRALQSSLGQPPPALLSAPGYVSIGVPPVLCTGKTCGDWLPHRRFHGCGGCQARWAAVGRSCPRRSWETLYCQRLASCKHAWQGCLTHASWLLLA